MDPRGGDAAQAPSPLSEQAVEIEPAPGTHGVLIVQHSDSDSGDAPILPAQDYEFYFWAKIVHKDTETDEQDLRGLGNIFWKDVQGNRLKQDETFHVNDQGFYGGVVDPPDEAVGATIHFAFGREDLEDLDRYEDAAMRVDEVLFERR